MEFFEAETQTSLSRLIPATGSDERRLYQQAIFVVVVVVVVVLWLSHSTPRIEWFNPCSIFPSPQEEIDLDQANTR